MRTVRIAIYGLTHFLAPHRPDGEAGNPGVIGQLPHRQIVLGHQRPQYQPFGLERWLLSHAPVYATFLARLSNLAFACDLLSAFPISAFPPTVAT